MILRLARFADGIEPDFANGPTIAGAPRRQNV